MEPVKVFSTVSVGGSKVDEVHETEASNGNHVSALTEAYGMKEEVKERALVSYNVFYEVLNGETFCYLTVCCPFRIKST
jgi:hypothetical protein